MRHQSSTRKPTTTIVQHEAALIEAMRHGAILAEREVREGTLKPDDHRRCPHTGLSPYQGRLRYRAAEKLVEKGIATLHSGSFEGRTYVLLLAGAKFPAAAG